MNSEHIGRYPFTVEPFSEDYKGRLSWGFLGNHLLRCASLHAGSHGFGYDEMQETRHVWVLSRLVVELEEMPRTGDKYTVETWVSAIYRQFTDRLFAITGESGRVFGYGHSVWALIDMDSRQPMELEALPDGGFSSAVTDRKIPIKGPGRIRVKTTIPDGLQCRSLFRRPAVFFQGRRGRRQLCRRSAQTGRNSSGKGRHHLRQRGVSFL